MNCEAVRELLSPSYDQELPPDAEAAVREHVERCPTCSQQLAEFAALSALAANMREPEVPAGMWASIDASLNPVRRMPALKTMFGQHSRQLATAALVLIAVSAAFFALVSRQPPDAHHEMADLFDQYLERFERQPDTAQEILLARYDGQLVTPQQAFVAVKFTPNAPETLPDGFSRSAMYVLKMPCCTCTQTIYKNDDGRVLAVFEHSEQQRSWFGARPQITGQCHGKETCLVQLQSELAACWKCGPRHVTVVGARDMEEVSALVHYLDAQQKSGLPAPDST
jgi:hypothetical protein